MSSEARKEQFRKGYEKQKAKREQAGITRKMVTLKAGEKVIIVKESDPNQTEIVQPEDERMEKIRNTIDSFRAHNKGTVSLARQKDLVLLIQQIEEILIYPTNTTAPAMGLS